MHYFKEVFRGIRTEIDRLGNCESETIPMSACDASPARDGIVANHVIEQIRRAAMLLFQPDTVTEVRVPNAGQYKTLSGYYNDPAVLVKDVAMLETKRFPGIYWTPNPVNTALLARANNNLKKYAKHTTADTDVLGHRWLMIDLDPKRPSGISSSEAEHQAALDLARHMRSELLKDGWPEPILSDSGNGAHLLPRIDLPNEAASTEFVRNVLAALSARFSTELVLVDLTTFNPSRIFKVYGTTARKGDSTEERPHRTSRILEAPTEVVPVPLELLKALASQAPAVKRSATIVSMPPAPRRSAFDLEQFLAEHEIQHHPPVPYAGGRKIVLDHCPFDTSHGAPDASVFERADGQLGFRCLHNSCEGKGWREFRACFETVERNTRALPDFQDSDCPPWGTCREWWTRENVPSYSRKYLQDAIEKVEHEKKWQWIDTYAYTQADGTPVLAKARYLDRANDKTQRCFLLTDKKGWRPRRRGEARALLYRWPELLTATQIFLVNDECAADRGVECLGIRATCQIDGEAPWPEELNQTFENKNVVVIAGKDEKGEQHAAAVGKMLMGVAGEIRVIHLPGPSARGDLCDWIDGGGTADQLQKLVENASPMQPETPNATAARAVSVEEPALCANWSSKLLINEFGEPRALLANVITALRHAPEWDGVLCRDEFALRTVARKPAPWGEIRTWGEREDGLTTDWLQHQGIRVSKEVAGQGIEIVAGDHTFHPVREYLDLLTWDGIPRLHEWLHRHLGVDNSPYSSAVGSRWMISGVARIYQPGCKADCCMILEGPQGIKKSTALRTLAEPWFIDQIPELGTKDSLIQIHGAWVVELAELDSISRAEVSSIKGFISCQSDHFRPPYGIRTGDFPRQCVFAGSVNHSTYLRDETGGRRFWPVECKAPVIDIDALAKARDQLWAEAVFLFYEGRTWWMDTPELSQLAEREQAMRYEGDPWDELILPWIRRQDSVSVAEVLTQCLEKRKDLWTQLDKNRVARCLRAAGWERFNTGPRGTREWRYRPADQWGQS